MRAELEGEARLARRRGALAAGHEPAGVQPVVDAAVGDTFRTLVRQFSQELCFYRELVQNAVDAGTDRVDIWLEHADGVGVIHVQDVGEGMDRTLIDTRLTRLFASSKDGDFTKIGQFGIGFVSVFAIEPQAVVVDTARHGEVWRIVFKPDGQFERLRLQQPLEGTHVRMYKPMEAEAWATFVERSEQSIRYWCRHSPVPVFFQGRPVASPFSLDCEVQARWQEPGTDIVVGLLAAGESFFGFYRGGITLLEGTDATALQLEPWMTGLAVKISSRYLEPTLSRDAVKTDGTYGKAMELLRRAVTEALADALYRKLETTSDGEYPKLLERGLPVLLQTLRTRGASRRCLATVDGRIALQDVLAAQPATRGLLQEIDTAPRDPVVFCEPWRGPVSNLLSQRGIPTLRCVEGDPLFKLLSAHNLHPLAGILLHVEPAPDPRTDVRSLVSAMVKLLKRAGLPLGAVRYAHWTSSHGPCLWAPRSGSLVHPTAAPASRKGLLINPQHPLVQEVGRLEDARTAAYLLGRSVCLLPGVPACVDTALLAGLLDARHA